MDFKFSEDSCIKCDNSLPPEFYKKREEENAAYEKLVSPPSSKKFCLAEEPFSLLELPIVAIDKIWHQLCEGCDDVQKFYLALHFVRPDFDISKKPSEPRKYLAENPGMNIYEKYIAGFHFRLPFELLRIATDPEYARKLGLTLPKKLLDSFSHYLLNDFYDEDDETPYAYSKEWLDEKLLDIKSDHNPKKCPDCKFVRTWHMLGHRERRYLCCEKYYANINLQLLKIMKDIIDDEFCDGSFDYREAAHTMLTDIIFHDVCYGTLQMEYWKYEASDEHSPYNHMKSVMDLLQPWDDELLKQIDNKRVIRKIDVSDDINEFPEFEKITRRRTNSCKY